MSKGCGGGMAGTAEKEEKGRALRLYNSMTRKKEEFRPVVPGKVRMYVSGISLCDSCHVGQARSFVFFDVLFRFLKHLGYEVTYVRDFNDIDHQIFSTARWTRVPASALTSKVRFDFLRDMEKLQCLKPTHQPRASYHVPEIIDMIQKIVDNGCGYMLNGDVYFSVDKVPNYGCLSRQKLVNNQASGCTRGSVDSQKKNSADFVLWTSSRRWELCWDSPWGLGRPGWSVECSAMSAYFLGRHFDIHGGSRHQMFPHHENQIAVNGVAFPDSVINCWMHTGHVKWAKNNIRYTMNNLFKICDITKNYHPLALRFFLLSTHYRSTITFTDSQLETASNILYSIYQTLLSVEEALTPFRKSIQGDSVPSNVAELIMNFESRFLKLMMNDIQTSCVLGDLMNPLKAMDDNLKKCQGNWHQMPLIEGLSALEKLVKDTLSCLGLFTSSNSAFEILTQMKEKAMKRAALREHNALENVEDVTQAGEKRDDDKSYKGKISRQSHCPDG